MTRPDLERYDPNLRQLDEQAVQELDEQEEERLRRLERDPFSFPDEEAFRRFRRSRGLR